MCITRLKCWKVLVAMLLNHLSIYIYVIFNEAKTVAGVCVHLRVAFRAEDGIYEFIFFFRFAGAENASTIPIVKFRKCLLIFMKRFLFFLVYKAIVFCTCRSFLLVVWVEVCLSPLAAP